MGVRGGAGALARSGGTCMCFCGIVCVRVLERAANGLWLIARGWRIVQCVSGAGGEDERRLGHGSGGGVCCEARAASVLYDTI